MTDDMQAISQEPIFLAVVVPCFNEEESLRHTAETLLAILDRLSKKSQVTPSSYIQFVDDGSTDGTWDLISDLNSSNSNIKGLKLSRNFGHQAAVLAGLNAVTGNCDAVISIDADLQQDPNAIELFVREFRLGNEVVLGVRNERGTDGWLKRTMATAFYSIMQLMGVNIIKNHADYRLLGKSALAALAQFHESNLFLRAICLQLGFKVGFVKFDVKSRQFGETKYTFKKMLRLARDGITSFSIVPLRMVSAIGFAVFAFATLMGSYVIWQALFVGNTIPGWASTTLPIYFIGGIQLLCLGIIGEYIGQIYETVKKRPRWICEQKLD
jgi:polyisoprenyl-phosphate glycosyltransferase